MKKAALWIGILALVALVAFLAFRPAGGSYRTVDEKGLLAEQSGGAQVVDVRSQPEYQSGHISGAINVPVDTLAQVAQNWDRNARYVLYCQTGARSAQGVAIMKSMGFKHVDDYSQGISGWTGQLVQGSQGAVSTTIPTSGKPVFIEFYTDT